MTKRTKNFSFSRHNCACDYRSTSLMATTNENRSTRDLQNDEISDLRKHFNDSIRILSSIGQFSYILKIRTDQYDVSLTLQLDGREKEEEKEMEE